MKRFLRYEGMVALLITLAAGLGLAASPQTENQTWSIQFPSFFYAWINTDEVSYDFNSSASAAGQLAGVTVGTITYEGANKANFETCINNPYIDGTIDPSGSFVGVTSSPSGDCYFAPTTLTDNATPTYSATYHAGSSTNGKADTDVLVAARGLSHFQVQTIEATPPTGMEFHFYPMALDSGSVLDPNTSDTLDPSGALGAVSSTSTSASVNWVGTNYGYYVEDHFFLYLLPVVHGLKLSPGAVDVGSSPSVTVTYTISAL